MNGIIYLGNLIIIFTGCVLIQNPDEKVVGLYFLLFPFYWVFHEIYTKLDKK